MGKVKTNFKLKRRTFIREWRKKRHLTLEQLAERVEVTAGAISQLERGQIGYTQPMIEALAAALRCEPEDLISRPPDAQFGLMLVWNDIPESERPRAIELLKAFARTGTDG